MDQHDPSVSSKMERCHCWYGISYNIPTKPTNSPFCATLSPLTKLGPTLKVLDKTSYADFTLWERQTACCITAAKGRVTKNVSHLLMGSCGHWEGVRDAGWCFYSPNRSSYYVRDSGGHMFYPWIGSLSFSLSFLFCFASLNKDNIF